MATPFCLRYFFLHFYTSPQLMRRRRATLCLLSRAAQGTVGTRGDGSLFAIKPERPLSVVSTLRDASMGGA